MGVALGAFTVESARWDLDNFEWQMQFCTSSTRFSSSVVLGFFFCCFLVVVGGLLFCWVFFVFQYSYLIAERNFSSKVFQHQGKDLGLLFPFS